MAINRYLYAVALVLCGFCYLVWGQWLSWVLLLALLLFPWLSLGLSLPAIARFRAMPSSPGKLPAGSWGELSLLGSCDLPVPPFRGRLRVTNLLTGEQIRYRPEAGIPTRHCGGCRVTVEKGRVCDYLGLFSFPIPACRDSFFWILPRPLPVDPLPEYLKSPESEPWDLRPYRPGDPLKRIHRKLSIKTDTLILRCPSRHHRPVELSVFLAGTPDELDRTLGCIFWLGQKLLEQNIPLLLRVHTGSQSLCLAASSPPELEQALCRLLCIPAGKDLGSGGGHG